MEVHMSYSQDSDCDRPVKVRRDYEGWTQEFLWQFNIVPSILLLGTHVQYRNDKS